jgi:WD40 repeat protein
MWALAITQDGKYLAASAYDGRVSVWDVQSGSGDNWTRIREYETKGSFGMCVTVVCSTIWENAYFVNSTARRERNRIGLTSAFVESGWSIYRLRT